MKRGIKAVSALFFFFVNICVHSATVIGRDDFDGNANYLTRVNSSAINAIGATWDIVNRSSVLSSNITDTSKYTASGVLLANPADTNGILESTKTDNVFGLYRGGLTIGSRSLTYTFNISGYTNLSFSADWAASGDVTDQGIKITTSIDGSAVTTNFSIFYSTDHSTTTMEDGRIITYSRSGYAYINGVKNAMLTDNFATYTSEITGTGSVLTLTLSMTGSAAGSAYAMDNLVLYSGSLAKPVAHSGFKFSLLASSTAVVESNAPTYRHVSYGSDSAQIMNFWKAESDKPTPVIFSIHGGGWHGGSMSETSDGFAYLSRGVSYCSIEYRMINSPSVLLPVPVLDAARALQFLRSKAAEWNIDKDRIVLNGGSAGACSSLWLAFHDDLADPSSSDPVARESTRVKGAFLTNAQTTLDPFLINEWIGMLCVNHEMIWDSVGASSGEDLIANWDKYKKLSWEFSPSRYLDAGDPPVYIKYGLSASLPPLDSSHAIHHPMFGIKLKEMSDSIGHTCYLEADGQPSPAVTAAQFMNSLLFE